jgi:glycosyltransferase involved in cell wall biosynthesis
MKSPDVAIVIPCYNAERYIAQTVESALGQDVTGGPASVEVIVIDDGSTDRSADVVTKLAITDDRLEVIRQVNSGVATARNAGLGACSQSVRFVLFLDADDVLEEDAVERLRNRLEQDQTLVAAFGLCSRIDSVGNRITAPDSAVTVRDVAHGRVKVIALPDRLGYWRILPVNPISTPGQVLLRREAIRQDTLFDSATVPCEDWDLWLRLSRVGDFGVIPHEVLRYRDHDVSASKRYGLMMRQRETVLRKQRDVVTTEEREDLRAAWRYAMYQFDAGLCRKWATQRLVDHQVAEALRYAVRSARFSMKFLVAATLGRPDVGSRTN